MIIYTTYINIVKMFITLNGSFLDDLYVVLALRPHMQREEGGKE
jgi:hypothetical protein